MQYSYRKGSIHAAARGRDPVPEPGGHGLDLPAQALGGERGRGKQAEGMGRACQDAGGGRLHADIGDQAPEGQVHPGKGVGKHAHEEGSARFMDVPRPGVHDQHVRSHGGHIPGIACFLQDQSKGVHDSRAFVPGFACSLRGHDVNLLMMCFQISRDPPVSNVYFCIFKDSGKSKNVNIYFKR